MNVDRVKLLLILISALLFLSFFKSRYLSPLGGVYTSFSDLGIHILASGHIEKADIFPYIHRDSIGEHGVSQYLPIYHGLLGFHVLAYAFELAGVPRLGSYQLILDIGLSLLTLTAIFFLLDSWRSGMRTEVILVITLSPLYYLFYKQAVEYGFYSQILSQSLLALSLYLYTKQRVILSSVIGIYAAFCYPDFIIWIGPLFLFITDRYGKLWKPFLVFLILVMGLVPFLRANLAGVSAGTPYMPLFCILFSFLFFRETRNSREIFSISLVFAIYIVALSLYNFRSIEFHYYAAKLASFSYLLFPILIIHVRPLSFRQGRWFFIIFFLFLISDESWSQLAKIMPRTINENYEEARKALLKGQRLVECQRKPIFILPQSSWKLIDLIIANSLALNYDMYSHEIAESSLRRFYPSATSFFDSLMEDREKQWKDFIEEKGGSNSLQSDLCLAIPNEYRDIFATASGLVTIGTGDQFFYVQPQVTRK